jgi:hypothetical protein
MFNEEKFKIKAINEVIHRNKGKEIVYFGFDCQGLQIKPNKNIY